MLCCAGAPQLKAAHAAAAATAEPSALADVLSQACSQLDATSASWEEGTPHRCALTLLSLSLCPAVPAVEFEGGLCWVSRASPSLHMAFFHMLTGVSNAPYNLLEWDAPVMRSVFS